MQKKNKNFSRMQMRLSFIAINRIDINIQNALKVKTHQSEKFAFFPINFRKYRYPRLRLLS